MDIRSLMPDTLRTDYSPLYDTLNLAAATVIGTKRVFFETPRGGTKGLELTNLEGKGFELPNPERMFVLAMRAIFIGWAIADIEAVLKQYALSLIVSGQPRWVGPLEYFASGAGVNAAYATTVAATTLQTNTNGVPDPRATAQVPLDMFVPIGTGETFRVEMEGSTYTMVGTGTLRIVLEGYYGRSV